MPKRKTLSNSAESLNNVQHTKCDNQKLNSDRLQSSVKLLDFEQENLQFRRFGAKIIVYFEVADILAPKLERFSLIISVSNFPLFRMPRMLEINFSLLSANQ